MGTEDGNYKNSLSSGAFLGKQFIYSYRYNNEYIDVIEHNIFVQVVSGFFMCFLLLGVPLYTVYSTINEILANGVGVLLNTVLIRFAAIVMALPLGVVTAFLFFKRCGNQRVEINYTRHVIDFKELWIQGHFVAESIDFSDISQINVVFRRGKGDEVSEYQLIVIVDDDDQTTKLIYGSMFKSRCIQVGQYLALNIGCDFQVSC